MLTEDSSITFTEDSRIMFTEDSRIMFSGIIRVTLNDYINLKIVYITKHYIFSKNPLRYNLGIGIGKILLLLPNESL